MKEQNNPICGHCGSKMSIQTFPGYTLVECPECNSCFTEAGISFYSCPICFSPLFVIYSGFQESILLCSNSDCPAYHPLDNSNLGGGEPIFSFIIYDKSVTLILPDDLSIAILDGGNNGVVRSPVLKKLAKALRTNYQNR